ncbi:MAG: hypothetical protein AABN95_08465 [Acidobacteriota bacterium]
MTIKFNFYDIYGFALPGFLLVAVLWLPFGLIENRWPDAEFSSALVGVIIAYFVGHVLQQVAGNAIPSNFLEGRYPSSVFLDEKDSTFSKEFKNRLRDQIIAAFQLDVSNEKERPDAFFLCRSALIKSKTVIYAEQFEGLYALMRGLCAAFGIAAVYYLGWAYSGELHRLVPSALGTWQSSGPTVLVGVVVATFALVAADRFTASKKASKKHDERTKYEQWTKYAKRLMIWSLFAAVFAAGYYLGLSSVNSSEHRGQLIAAAVLSFFASERCYAGYQGFAQDFAKAVYRDFSNYEKPATGHEANSNTEAEP